MSISLAANVSTLFPDVPLLDRFERAAGAGFTAVEMQFPYDTPAEAVAAAARNAGVTVALINAPAGDLAAGERGLLIEGGSRLEEATARAVAYAQAIGCRRVHVLTGRGDPASLAASVLNLRATAARLRAAGLMLLLEPLNPADQPGYALPSLDVAEAWRAHAGCANIRLQFDAYHAERSGVDILEALDTHLPAIGHIQVAAALDRGEPDPGVLRPMLKRLARGDYNGYVGCEYTPRGDTVLGLRWATELGLLPEIDPSPTLNRDSHR